MAKRLCAFMVVFVVVFAVTEAGAALCWNRAKRG